MKKICFIIADLGMGGSQKVFLHLLNNLDRNKYKLSLILICQEGENYKNLKEDIIVKKLECSRVRYSLFKLIKTIKELSPDIVISTIVDLNLFMGLFVIPFFYNKKIKFIARESHVLSMTHSKGLKYVLKKLSLKNFNKIIAQSNDMYKDFIENFKLNPDKCIVINNPIDIMKIQEYLKTNMEIEYQKKDKNLVCVGRLEEQKGYDFLIPAMKKLKTKNIKLFILGEGKERENIENLIKENGLIDSIFLLGKKENPYIYMERADLYLLPSRYEGFPNALIEANICGAYCLVNDCQGGVNEIIVNKINGEILDFSKSDEVVNKILENINERKDKEKIKEITINRYSMRKILNDYEKVF